MKMHVSINQSLKQAANTEIGSISGSQSKYCLCQMPKEIS